MTGASYRIRLKKTAARELECIEPAKVRQRLVEKILSLAQDPRPRGAEKLSARHDRYRVRQGRYRILYEIQDDELVVFVVKIGHRREVYR